MRIRNLHVESSPSRTHRRGRLRRGMLALPLLLALAGQAFAMGGGEGGGHGGGGGGDHGGGMGGGGMGGGGMGDGGDHSGGMGGADGGMGNMGDMPGMMGPDTMHDHEMALEQHRSGMAPPLKTLMRQIRQKYPGKVLDVRMVRDRKGSAYMFTIMQGNRIRQVRVPLSGNGKRLQGRRIFNFNSGRR